MILKSFHILLEFLSLFKTLPSNVNKLSFAGQHGATPEPVPSGPVSLAGAEEPSDEQASVEGPKRKGHCKWFNVAKGWGFISPEDGGQDIFVHQSVIKMSGFRSLGDEEKVEFECKASGKGFEATTVSGPQGADCLGSHRRPTSKKRFRKIRSVLLGLLNSGSFLSL